MKRPTIADIARRAGVTKSTVSFALNGRPGVSEATRARILDIAREMGWQPSRTARALSGGRAGVLGLVVDRPARTLGVEPFYMQLISGIEAELSSRDTALLLQVTDDAGAQEATYRCWWAERRVDGVFLVDLRVDDERTKVLAELGMPAIVVGGPHGLGGLPGLWNDEIAPVRAVLEYLVALGHRRIARVAGLPGLWHTVMRDEAFERIARELGVTPSGGTADYTGDAAARVTRRLLASSAPPTAIVYDNDVMAVAGLGVAAEMNIRVPDRLSIVAWDDSVLCRLVHPPLTAVGLDIAAYGAEVARRLADLAAGRPVTSACHATAVLSPRGSTGPVR
ncbi:LacI family DNA-binding transcriptional regulator [Actinoallomurus iriomotensis]|uniref:LacI family transcriptional regulator n=1 Tax=Actinoallomurus iriomotensis TaxID=478107 RepID=A0A9W6RP71_9ACTN|nr:LacI family DNA-binding transcriptional regulator [Actinoallomurus iriomotensis]GLY79486.1 LacI family transcriptional regulator [Actinoallomurus iriomotensis]